MTDTEKSLVEAALNWRRCNGPADPCDSLALREMCAWAEAVIRGRNRAAQDDHNDAIIAGKP